MDSARNAYAQAPEYTGKCLRSPCYFVFQKHQLVVEFPVAVADVLVLVIVNVVIEIGTLPTLEAPLLPIKNSAELVPQVFSMLLHVVKCESK